MHGAGIKYEFSGARWRDITVPFGKEIDLAHLPHQSYHCWYNMIFGNEFQLEEG